MSEALARQVAAALGGEARRCGDVHWAALCRAGGGRRVVILEAFVTEAADEPSAGEES